MIAQLPPDHPLWPDTFPEQMNSMRAEMETYYRELPRLIEDGEEGRYVVVKGGTVYSVWDTFRDARQRGGELFGMEQFMVQEVDARFLVGYGKWFGPRNADGEAA